MATGSWHFQMAVHSILSLRHGLNCNLPIEIFYNGEADLNQRQVQVLKQLPGVSPIDINKVFDLRGTVGGWEIKPFAMLGSSFQEVIFLDADVLFLQLNKKEKNPEMLFKSQGYVKTGTTFFHDRSIGNGIMEAHIWTQSFLRHPTQITQQTRFWKHKSSHEQESGVIVVDKRKSFSELLTACSLNHGLIGKKLYSMFHGDKESYWISWEMNQSPYYFVPGYGGSIGYFHEVILKPPFDTFDNARSSNDLAVDSQPMIGSTSLSTNIDLTGKYVCGGLMHAGINAQVLNYNSE
ncbi:hypothetical protein HK096_010149 [Nowakowskiella sp. JEL0078]|nr:hypothetical protein HK096_010149 [Nowakowskiella sp. JEL0078]